MADTNLTYAQRYYQAALDYFDQGQFTKALEHISKAILRDPKNPDYLSTKGVFLHKMNDLSQAIDSYRAALAIAPSHAFAHFNLGLIFMKMGKTVEAIQEWEAVVRVNPGDVNALFNIAVAMAQIGRQKEAISYYERVIKIQPHHVQAHQNLGILFRDLRKFDKAKFHLNKLRMLDSTYSEVVSAEILRCEEQEFLEKSKALDPAKIATEMRISRKEESAPQLSDGIAAFIQGRFIESLRIAQLLVKSSPTDFQARILRGESLAALGKHDEAIQEFMSIIAENPDIPEVYFQLANLFLGIGDQEKALENFEKVKKIDPNFPVIEENIANLKKAIQEKGKKR